MADVVERMGLAEETGPGRWHLNDDLETTLRQMGERGDIIKAMHRELADRGLSRGTFDAVIFDPGDPSDQPIVGRVVARGLADEIRDEHYLIADAVDGRTHYIDIGRGDATEPTPENCIVRLTPKSVDPRQVDRTVAEIAAANDGRYSIDIHLKHDPSATERFANTHVRRLEAIRRVTGGVAREPDGTWIIAPDHVDRAVEYQRRRVGAEPVAVEKLSSLSLEHQVGFDGGTWLDRELVAENTAPLKDVGFGHDVREAQARQRQWLIAQGLAHKHQRRAVYRTNMLAILRQRELTRVAGQLSDEVGLAYGEARPGERVEGTLCRSVELASGKYAVIEKSREFTLVPWRPVLERHIGKEIVGVMHGQGISWTIGPQRGGPGVS